MVDYTKRLGMCLIVAASLSMAACGDDTTQPGQESCTSNADCKNEALPVCNTDTGKCEKAPDVPGDEECKSNADCKDEALPVCNTDTGKCEKAPEQGECSVDADCNDSNKECKDSQCVAKEQPPEKTCADEGKEDCSGLCVDTKSDVNNCGSCGNACDTFHVCNNGTCEFKCPDGYAQCGNLCIDTNSDDSHCGACDNACPTNSHCENGQCGAVQCEDSNLTNCNNTCVDLSNNIANCGSCDNACNPGEICENKTCVVNCLSSQTKCGDKCYNTKNDPEHCGGCDVKCNPGQVCNDGFCANECKDENCTCDSGRACKVGDSYACVDESSIKNCGCDISSEGANCDELANVEGAACSNGACVYEKCGEGFDNCDEDASNGCEADLNSVDHCGGCNISCATDHASSTACIEGACSVVCEEGFNACNGKCVNADTMKDDVENCGFCGNKCGDGQVCNNGFCQVKKCGNDDYVSIDVYTLDGTKSVKAYCITDQNELVELASYVENGKAYPPENKDNAFILMKDVEIVGSDWTPIGTEGRKFTGIFLGNGHKITSKTPVKLGRNGGFFGVVDGGTLDGFNIEYDVDLKEAGDLNAPEAEQPFNIGALAGNVNKSMISRSQVTSNMRVWRYVGGVAGRITDSTVSHVNGDVKMVSTVYKWNDYKDPSTGYPYVTKDYIGGAIGYGSGMKINSCQFNTTVNPINSSISSLCRSDYIGGLAGYLASSEVTDSKTTGKLTSSSCHAGGLLGGTDHSKITSCISEVDEQSQYYFGSYGGGLIGVMSSSTVDNCHAYGFVKQNSHPAGLIGSVSGKSVVTNSSAHGEVQGWHPGGFISALDGSTVENCETYGNVMSVSGGGFFRTVNNSKVSKCIAHGNVSGGHWNEVSHQIGGFAYTISKSTIEDCSSQGSILSDFLKYDSNSQNGFVHETANSTFKNCFAAGNVKGLSGRSAGFVGKSSGGNFEKCAAYGSIIGDKGSAGFVALSDSGNTYTECYAVGDATGAENVGSFMGNAINGTHNLKNSYGLGRVQGTLNVGGIAGAVQDSTTLYMENAYWWEGACNSSPCNTGVGLNSGTIPLISSYQSFSLNDKNEPVLEDSQKLVDALNSDSEGWVSSKCMLDYGTGPIEYNIPVIKELKPSFCE